MSDELISNEATAPQATASPPVAAAPTAPAPAAAAVTVEAVEPALPGSADVPSDWADIPEAENFASLLHSLDVGGDVVRQILNEYSVDSDEAITTMDAQDKAECLAALRSFWSPSELEANLQLAKTYLQNNLPDGVAQLVGNASLGGRLLLNDPATVMGLVDMAKKAPRVPAPTGDVERDIANIELVMRTDPDKYRADTGLQLRLRSLYAKRIAKNSPTQ